MTKENKDTLWHPYICTFCVRTNVCVKHSVEMWRCGCVAKEECRDFNASYGRQIVCIHYTTATSYAKLYVVRQLFNIMKIRVMIDRGAD